MIRPARYGVPASRLGPLPLGSPLLLPAGRGRRIRSWALYQIGDTDRGLRDATDADPRELVALAFAVLRSAWCAMLPRSRAHRRRNN